MAFWGKDKEVRILMVGLDSAGKTTILYRLQVGGRLYKHLCQLMVDWRSGLDYTQCVIFLYDDTGRGLR